MEERNIPFNKFYKRFNIMSLFLILFSLILLTFKGLNYGVDFKGGTLIELRTLDKTLNISDLRKSFNKLNLGDVTVKEFGKENDYVIKFEKKQSIEENFIENIKIELSNDIGNIFEFRRVESVGPKVSNELLKSGIILTVGMAVDANVLIYERIKEEIKSENNKILAFDSGYVKSKTTILDANITTLIAALILFLLGSGPVKGFALTLGVGILTTLFSVYFIARLFTSLYVIKNKDKEKLI